MQVQDPNERALSETRQRETLREAELRTLESIADGASLKDVLDQLCTAIDLQIAPSVTTVLLKDAERECLWHGGGPGVPREWLSAVIPVPVAFEAGLCGTAAFLKQRVIVCDVATEPNWRDEFRDLALRNGIRGAWSEPILTKHNEVLGTFALYSHDSRVPTEEDLALIQGAGHIARIAIERQRSQESLQRALEDVQKSEAKLRLVIDTIPTIAYCNLPDGTNEFSNREWEKYTGRTSEESSGWGWQACFHPDDLPQVMDKWLGFLAAGEPGEAQGRLRRYDKHFLTDSFCSKHWAAHRFPGEVPRAVVSEKCRVCSWRPVASPVSLASMERCGFPTAKKNWRTKIVARYLSAGY